MAVRCILTQDPEIQMETPVQMLRFMWCVPLLLCTAIPAVAGPITYDMVFTTTNGTTPAAGSFIYQDSSEDHPPFSDFIVTWGGVSFDFTTAANSFSSGGILAACLPGRNECGDTTDEWDAGLLYIGALGDSSHSASVLTLSFCAGTDCEQLQAFAPPVTGESGGGFGVEEGPESVPEPGTITMMLIGVLAVVGAKQVQNRRHRPLPDHTCQ